jgi:hypothetical protein
MSTTEPTTSPTGSSKWASGPRWDISDRWLYGWALGYPAVGAVSLLVPLYVLALDGSALVGLGTGVGSAAGGALAGVLGYRTTFGLAGGVVLVGLLLAVASGRGAVAAGPTGASTDD